MLIKYSCPTNFDKAPQGTVWSSIKEEGEPVRYIQVNDDPEVPKWLPMGQFLEKVFGDCIENEDFVDSCIAKYYKKPFNKIKCD